MKAKEILCLLTAGALVVGLAGGAWAGPQASISLINSQAALCHANDTAWSITKTADASTVTIGGQASWTVTATKGNTGHNYITVNGFMGVKNGGSADATIGNIVVNLQKRVLVKGKYYWISAAADVATAFSGDAALSANIVANATQEDPKLNLSNGVGNYTSSGTKGVQGTFTEGLGSGSLSFFDVDNNDIWAIKPEKTIHPGDTLNLLFSATFDNTVLGIPVGAQVRAEVIVTFGNAGGRGGSGASAQNIDIDGDGAVNNNDEAWVRSVPTRFSLEVPPLKACNDSVLLTDSESDLSTTGTVQYSDFSNDGIGDGVEIGAGDPAGTKYSYNVSALVTGGDAGSQLCNTAHLDSLECQDCSVSVIIGYNPDLTPIYHQFPCCQVIALEDSACVTLEKQTGGGFERGDYCTYDKGEWGSQGPVGDMLATCFYSVYPPAPNSVTYPADPGGGQVEVGIPGAGGYSMIFKADWVNTAKGNKPATYEVKPAAYFIRNYLSSGGPGGKLVTDLINPDTSASGQLGVEVVALELNVSFSGSSCSGMPGGFGDLIYSNPDDAGDSLNGMTISQILAAANTALGGGALPSGYDYTSLRQLLTYLNGAFPNCHPTGWTQRNLAKPSAIP
jgi:hypothetical protein